MSDALRDGVAASAQIDSGLPTAPAELLEPTMPAEFLDPEPKSPGT